MGFVLSPLKNPSQGSALRRTFPWQDEAAALT